MGVNCCSYEKEPMEIAVTKPEENIKEKIYIIFIKQKII